MRYIYVRGHVARVRDNVVVPSTMVSLCSIVFWLVLNSYTHFYLR